MWVYFEPLILFYCSEGPFPNITLSYQMYNFIISPKICSMLISPKNLAGILIGIHSIYRSVGQFDILTILNPIHSEIYI